MAGPRPARPLSVATGANDKSFMLEAGALRLNSAVTGDIAIPPGLLKFDIFTAGDEADRTMVAEGLLPNDIVTLNAGTYHIVSYFGDDQRRGPRRPARRAGPVDRRHALSPRQRRSSFKLVSEEGGEAIADVEWTVKTADGATVFSDLGAFPSTVLAEGDYLVLAKQGEQVFNREFQVQAGSPREIEVLTSGLLVGELGLARLAAARCDSCPPSWHSCRLATPLASDAA